VGDFNRDGRPDVAVVGRTAGGDNQVNLLLGQGNGTFITLPVPYTHEEAGFLSVAAGSLDGGNFADDLVVVNGRNGGRVTVIYNAGTDNRAFESFLLVGIDAKAVTIGDFDGIAGQDIVVGGFSDIQEIRFFSNPNAGQAAFPLFGVAFNTILADIWSLATGDFDGDGRDDVGFAGTDGAAQGFVGVLPGGAAGLGIPFFSGPFNGGNPVRFTGLAKGDFDGNGIDDLIVTDFMQNTSHVVVGRADRAITAAPVLLPAGALNGPIDVVAADFNGDGKQDFAVANFFSETVITAFGNGIGGFALSPGPGASLGAGVNPVSLVTAQFSSTGKFDLVVGSEITATAYFLQNYNNRTFFAVGSDPGHPGLIRIYDDAHTNAAAPWGTFSPLGPAWTSGYRVAVGDVTGDGIDDLIVATGPGGITVVWIYDGASILVNPSNPTHIGSITTLGFAGLGAFVAVGNIDGKGPSEIIVGADRGGDAIVRVYQFAPGEAILQKFINAYPGFRGGVRVASADVNGDGIDDIITAAGFGSTQINVYLGDASITLAGRLPSFFGVYQNGFQGWTGGAFVTADDFDGDGYADIIVSADQGGGPQVQVFSGKRVTTGDSTTSNGGFNNIIAAGFSGGTRVGTTVGEYSKAMRRILISAAGPVGDQLTGFDVFGFLQDNTKSPHQFFGSQFAAGRPGGVPATVS